METLKRIFNFIYSVLIFFLVFVAGLLAVSSLDFPNTPKLYTVQSGSMEPKLKVGSLIASYPQKDYSVGDIVTFKSESEINLKNPKTTTTHRINQIKTEDNRTLYFTKGDANNSPDIDPVSKNQIVGKLAFAIPLLGFPISFARTQTGLIVMIIIPTTLIVYSEIINIKNEIISLIQKKKGISYKKELSK